MRRQLRAEAIHQFVQRRQHVGAHRRHAKGNFQKPFHHRISKLVRHGPLALHLHALVKVGVRHVLSRRRQRPRHMLQVHMGQVVRPRVLCDGVCHRTREARLR